MNEDKWVKPRNCVPIKYLFKPYEDTEEWRKNDNKFIVLADKDKIKEEK